MTINIGSRRNLLVDYGYVPPTFIPNRCIIHAVYSIFVQTLMNVLKEMQAVSIFVTMFLDHMCAYVLKAMLCKRTDTNVQVIVVYYGDDKDYRLLTCYALCVCVCHH